MPAAVDPRVRVAAVAGRSVRRGIAVGLEFVVAEAAVAGVVGPVARTDGAVGGAVEFVAPLGRPGYWSRRGGGTTLSSSAIR